MRRRITMAQMAVQVAALTSVLMLPLEVSHTRMITMRRRRAYARKKMPWAIRQTETTLCAVRTLSFIQHVGSSAQLLQGAVSQPIAGVPTDTPTDSTEVPEVAVAIAR